MKVNINGKDYEYKDSFSDYSIDEYLEAMTLFSKPVIERVEGYTGIPQEILSQLPVRGFSDIAGSVAFVEDANLLTSLSPPFIGKDVGLESFAKIEKAKDAIKKGIAQAIPEIASIYTGTDIKGRALLEVWNTCSFYLNSVNAFFERFKKMNLHEYSDEELEAGVEAFEGFKHYPVVFSYGKSRGMTNDEVLSLPAIEVYTELLYDFEQSEYQKRYAEIMRNRAEHFAKAGK